MPDRANEKVANGSRYRVVFTPLGWLVVDTKKPRDPLADMAMASDPGPKVALGSDNVCGFCKGQPVTDAASWLDGKPRPPAPCPRCGKTAGAA